MHSMAFSIRNKPPSPLELLYAELKKQSVLEQNSKQILENSTEEKSSGIYDDVRLSPEISGENESTRKKHSLPVTPDEMQALRSKLSVYA